MLRDSGAAKGGPSVGPAIFCGALPNDARLPASVYSKYMYLQINHPFLHERALTVAPKHKKLVELALNKGLGLWLSIENCLYYVN